MNNKTKKSSKSKIKGVGSNTNFAILGLGRFGMSIAETLSEYDVDILVVDNDEAKIQHVMEFTTQAVVADVSDESVLKKLGIGNFDVVVVGTGEDFEASQMAAMVAMEEGAGYVVVKARNFRQKKILESLGVSEVILVEYEMGSKMARKLVGNSIMDILDDSASSFIKEMKPKPEWIGKTIRQADIRKKHSISILGVMHNGKLNMALSGDYVICDTDIFVVVLDEANKN